MPATAIPGAPCPPRRIFCIGRNYAAHAAELGNALPDSPVVFLKPPTALVPHGADVLLPMEAAGLHFETELVVCIGRDGICRAESDAPAFIHGLSLGFDLTQRDLQDTLKKQGLPWEKAKAFDGSAPAGDIVPFAPFRHDLRRLTFSGAVNGAIRQHGDTALMLFPIPRLLVEISRWWRLEAGDLVFTGTPSGVGPVDRGDVLSASAPWCGEFSWTLR
jgi:2-keto-4-pentenoate hydratase/2-oxohepta-3-ene-1,7-dioic acid hydratase in catechol pathway